MTKTALQLSAYNRLKENVRKTLLLGQRKIEQAKVESYWETGRLIQKDILANKDRADYGRQVILRLSEDLDISDSVLRRTLQFYQAFPISAPARKLTWAHYCELLPIEDEETRRGLVLRAQKSEWTRDELRRKIKDEIWSTASPQGPGSNGSKPEIQKPTPLKARLGTLYTYRLIQPEQFSTRPSAPEKMSKSSRAVFEASASNDVLIDLGFQTYRRLYKTELKPGTIIQSVWNEAKEDYKIQKSTLDETELFTYKAFIERIVDGDTLRVKIDLGFDTWARQYLRLRGIDCPEMTVAEGKDAKKFVESELKDVPYIIITSTKSDKYDRYLADVWTGKNNEIHLNNLLLEKGLALPQT